MKKDSSLVGGTYDNSKLAQATFERFVFGGRVQ